jgi:hypothetical protein
LADVTIHFQDGFAGDTVEIRANDKLVLRAENVTTRKLLGLASTHRVEVPDGPVRLEVRVVGQPKTTNVAVNTESSPYIGVSATASAPAVLTSQREFGYA